VVKIKVEKITVSGLINLYDGNGRLMLSKTFSRKQDQIVFPASNLKTGMYMIILEAEGRRVDHVKIEVIN
jgi:hypothetical protein